MKKKKPTRSLWFIDRHGELWLGEAVDLSWSGPWFIPKIIDRGRVFLENPPRPLTVESIRTMNPSHCLDTEDVSKLAECNRLTVHRHVWAGRLKPVRMRKTGQNVTDETRMLLFRADSVLEWYSRHCPIKTGRPRKEEIK